MIINGCPQRIIGNTRNTVTRRKVAAGGIYALLWLKKIIDDVINDNLILNIVLIVGDGTPDYGVLPCLFVFLKKKDVIQGILLLQLFNEGVKRISETWIGLIIVHRFTSIRHDWTHEHAAQC